MKKWKDLNPETKRLVEEVIGLVIMVIVVLFVFVIKPGTPQAKVNATPPIQTNFNTSSLQQLQSQNTNYPTVNQNDLGRSDPFAPLD